MAENELKALRTQIREIDEQLLGLFARRQELARKVGEAKLAHHLPIKDYKVEKDVIDACRARAKAIGLYEDAAEDMMKLLINYSCRVQEEYHGKARERAPGARRKVAIVGGSGLMGQWLARFLESFGHDVSLFDAKPAAATGSFPAHATLAEAAQTAEVVVLATPITVTPYVLGQLVTLRTKALVFDICSLKSPLLDSIERAQKAGLRVTSVHPMFGPLAQWLAGRNILLCETGKAEWTEEAASLFKESAASLVRVPLARHDEFMGYVLGLSHLANLVFGATLERSGLPLTELRSIGSTTFTAQAQVTAPVVAENQELYYEIQAENGYTPAVLETFRETLDEYTRAILARDREAFKALMEKSRRYFHPR